MADFLADYGRAAASPSKKPQGRRLRALSRKAQMLKTLSSCRLSVRQLLPEDRPESCEDTWLRIRDGVERAGQEMVQRGACVQAALHPAELPLPRVPARNRAGL